VIRQSAYPVEPWAIRETGLVLDNLAQSESVFALSNGHIGLRGNLDEGEPAGLPGTYMSGFYESRPLPYAERGYGFPEAGDAVVNVTDGKIIRLLVEDEPFDVRYGMLRKHERELDLRAGLLRRSVEWVSPSGTAVRVSSTRLVSFAQRAVAAIFYEVEPIEHVIPVVVQSELIANEALPGDTADPRAAAALAKPLRAADGISHDMRVLLAHVTAVSDLRMAAAMDHLIEGPGDVQSSAEHADDLGRVTVSAEIAPGRPLRVTKFLAYGWSSQRSVQAVRDQVTAALAEAHHAGWNDLVNRQRAYLDEFWDHADVELEGDAELQQAVRFALFHTIQAGARTEKRAVAAKGLTGPGYDGHAFWDTESYVLPVLTYTSPHAARDALCWRHATLDLARERASQLHLKGSAFPWRTIRGHECSGYWPAGTAAFHINADIADAVVRYVNASGDESFEVELGLELLVETARLWRSLGHHDGVGQFRIDGVTGPDEYSAVADNNVYTNLMAQRNLVAAADAAERHPDVAARLGVDAEEAAAWRDAARDMEIPYDEQRGLHPQAESFLEHQAWDFEAMTPEDYPLLLHYPYFDLYRKQVVKQADLVLAMHFRGDAFSQEQKARNFAYYEQITVRDSSLSACAQSVMAAETGHVELAYDYLGEAALLDLEDLEHNTRDGLHIASLAGTWIGIVAGLAGLRDHDGQLSFMPRLPMALTQLTFRIGFRGCALLVEIEPGRARYTLLAGGELELIHHGQSATVTLGAPAELEIPTAPVLMRPRQPPGREPARRQPSR
jgi:alpha,alpha-trehalose phosphorylase